jgi:hypothetical protein
VDGSARGGYFYLATSGALLLATSGYFLLATPGDFLMAMDICALRGRPGESHWFPVRPTRCHFGCSRLPPNCQRET